MIRQIGHYKILNKISEGGMATVYLATIQLTNNNSWDESSTFSPDGSKIAFTSTKGGYPDIYNGL